MIFQWWFIEYVCKIQWTFQWFIEHLLCWEMWQDKSYYIFVHIYKNNVHCLEWSDLYYLSIMMFKFNISLDSSCEKSIMWESFVNTRYHDFATITDHIQIKIQQQCLFKQTAVCYTKKLMSLHD